MARKKATATTIVYPPEKCVAVPLSIVRKARMVALADVAAQTIDGCIAEDILNGRDPFTAADLARLDGAPTILPFTRAKSRPNAS